jgi:hypothetical protein
MKCFVKAGCTGIVRSTKIREGDQAKTLTILQTYLVSKGQINTGGLSCAAFEKIPTARFLAWSPSQFSRSAQLKRTQL